MPSPQLPLSDTTAFVETKNGTGVDKTGKQHIDMAEVIATPTTSASKIKSYPLPDKPKVNAETYADIQWMVHTLPTHAVGQGTLMRPIALDYSDTSSGAFEQQTEDSRVSRSARPNLLQAAAVPTLFPPWFPPEGHHQRPAPRHPPSRADVLLFQAALNGIRKSSATPTRSPNPGPNEWVSMREGASPNDQKLKVVDGVVRGRHSVLQDESFPPANPRDHLTDTPMWAKGSLDYVTMTSADGVSHDMLSPDDRIAFLPSPQIDTTRKLRNPSASIESLPTSDTLASPAAMGFEPRQGLAGASVSKVFGSTGATEARPTSSTRAPSGTVAGPSAAPTLFSASKGVFKPVPPTMSVFGAAFRTDAFGQVAPNVPRQQQTHAKPSRSNNPVARRARALPPPLKHLLPRNPAKWHTDGLTRKTARGSRGGQNGKRAKEEHHAVREKVESETKDLMCLEILT
ncbi:hypothetical protein QFC21_000237 [Naganishia friedmannii]|uniref:Uncharacterized protein n=1 Tax=Naganishia friedmannii TaxID=89922 RepID=A0ACC2WCX8_9TREE|nr:hypothetical protein QFC21_000237 [Naganishia friedmannii]